MSGSTAKLATVKKPELVGFDTPKVASQLPIPKGWRMLIAIPEVEEKTMGGIIKADATKHIEQTSTVVGCVLAMGDRCYVDEDRFGADAEPWCKEGDFVLIGAYKGVRFNIRGKEFRIINDDTVQAVVDDPRGYTRA
jgi:co-chaperonin GroES (HSP10)|tara:strand:- start:4329 stop:4739 length:411 start_codon:yes stop_codon:yes gene_type:complete